jgi:hypothetical protein
VSIIIGSFENLTTPVLLVLRIFEYLSVAMFTLEYLIRFWTEINQEERQMEKQKEELVICPHCGKLIRLQDRTVTMRVAEGLEKTKLYSEALTAH